MNRPYVNVGIILLAILVGANAYCSGKKRDVEVKFDEPKANENFPENVRGKRLLGNTAEEMYKAQNGDLAESDKVKEIRARNFCFYNGYMYATSYTVMPVTSLSTDEQKNLELAWRHSEGFVQDWNLYPSHDSHGEVDYYFSSITCHYLRSGGRPS